MSAFFGALVVAFVVTFVVLFLRRVRRIESDMDYAEFRSAPRENQFRYLARVVANVIVSSP